MQALQRRRDAGSLARGNRQDTGRTAHGPLLMADKPFGRYGSMQPQAVRQPDVTGQSYIERARRTREMLRSMDPEKVKQVIEFHKDLNFFQALEVAKRESKLIVPNSVHDGILAETKDQEYLEENYPVWTGTLIIYKAPSKPFGEKVVFSWKDVNDLKSSISFTVPKQFRGKKNCALVIEHPDFELVKLRNNRYELRVSDERIHQIEDFPRESGKWYLLHPETKIPQGEPVVESKDARYLWRDNSSYIGSLARVVYDIIYRRDVGAYSGWSLDSGVALVPFAATEK